MLVSLSIANFRSFLAEQTFSLVASRRLGAAHQNHLLPIPNSDEFVLKVAAIYGANGAGKSNLFRALRYIRQIALGTKKKNQGTRREKFHTLGDNLPSTFDVQFIANEKLYRFGFSLDDTKILEEWLVEVIGTRERIIYERITDENGKVQIESDELVKVSDKIAALITIGGPQNQSFLATINATLENEDVNEEILSVMQWFARKLSMVAPDEVYAPLGHELSKDSSFLKFAGDFLKASSTGVDHLQTKKQLITEEELKSLVPEKVWKELIQNIEDRDGEIGVIRLPGGKSLIVERTNENRFYTVSVQASHKCGNDYFQLDLSDESDGTRRLLDFVPALHRVKKDEGVYFIDEIDRSMHPMLVWQILEFFTAACSQTACQMIVTTHESNLLDLDLLRRDEIWFAEKDLDLETRIYSLMDYQVRSDLELRRNYLKGRFGAIPFLGDFSKINPKDCINESTEGLNQ